MSVSTGSFGLLTLLLATTVASACDVPVFRYALERWPVDDYQLIAVMDQPLSAPEKQALATIEEASFSGSGKLNVRLNRMTRKELADTPFASSVPKALKDKQNQLVLFYPYSARIPQPVWSGPISKASVARLMHSPARTALVKQLLAGSSGVFVMLESGNKAANQAALAIIKERIKVLNESLELPGTVVDAAAGAEGILADDPSNQLQSSVPFRIEFTTLRFSRKDAEDVFVASLMGLEPDLPELTDQPMIFTVYGRGRCLMPLIGDGIDPELIEQIGFFLGSRCSCQVKAQNPGTDLLLHINWDEALYEDAPR